jgi:hypothetical protein
MKMIVTMMLKRSNGVRACGGGWAMIEMVIKKVSQKSKERNKKSRNLTKTD